MKIGVDACTWHNRRGFGRFTRELLEAVLACDSNNEYLFFVDNDGDDYKDLPANAKKIVVRTKSSTIEAASAIGRRSIKDLWAMSREVWNHELDLFFFPAVYSYYPIFNRAKIIVTIHDIIADNHPDHVFPNIKLKMFWKLKQNAAILQSDLILTVSEYSKREILNFFNPPESKVKVISEAAHAIFTKTGINEEIVATLATYNLQPNEKFILYVGGISPHKNLKTLVSAFKYITTQKNSLNTKLILVGDYQDDPFFSAYPELKKQIEQLSLTDRVIFTGFVHDSELCNLYNAATLVVLPSLEEGFGLPAVEAMACGTPVAASNRGSLPEILGSAGSFFDPLDLQNMAQSIKQILDNEILRTRMSEAGLRRSQEFMWKKAATQTLAAFNELVKR